jgi:hypothetical protein
MLSDNGVRLWCIVAFVGTTAISGNCYLYSACLYEHVVHIIIPSMQIGLSVVLAKEVQAPALLELLHCTLSVTASRSAQIGEDRVTGTGWRPSQRLYAGRSSQAAATGSGTAGHHRYWTSCWPDR